MRFSPILAIACLCGIAAFLWMLLAQPRPAPARPASPARQEAPRPREVARDREGAERAVLARPNGFYEWYIAAVLREVRDPAAAAEAWRAAERSADIYAHSKSPDAPDGMLFLGLARERLGNADGTREAFERAAAMLEDELQVHGAMTGLHRPWMRLAQCRQRLGQPARAREAWERAKDLVDQVHATDMAMGMMYDRACIKAQIGEIGAALWSLEQATGKGFKDYEWASLDELLAPLRKDPGFKAWLARGGVGGG